MDTLTTEFITLQVEGSAMRAYIAKPTEQASQAIIVFQEAFGVNAHIRDVTERFAKQGFFAIAPEMYHRTAPTGFEVGYDNFAGAQSHFNAITPEGIATDTRAVFEYLQSQGFEPEQINSIGFCLGGRASFIANSAVPLAKAVCFYGGGIDKVLELTSKLHGPTLFCWGGKDTHITTDLVRKTEDSLKEQGKAYTSIVFGEAPHGFFCDARSAYHPHSAELAWSLVLDFLK